MDEYKKTVWVSTQTIFLYSVLIDYSLDEYKKTVWVSTQTIFLFSILSLDEYKKTVWASTQRIFLYSYFFAITRWQVKKELGEESSSHGKMAEPIVPTPHTMFFRRDGTAHGSSGSSGSGGAEGCRGRLFLTGLSKCR